ncbi:MAG TPA: RNA-binding protein [Thermohalobaculum sp.]|nr:RNA-binding protein [Thermohalobaculum sp.]
MTRGGRTKERDGPERRCIASGESGPADRLIRFVLDPEGRVIPDLAGRLPGRGAWLTADRALVERAEKKNLFSRAFRQQVPRPEGLADLLETLLVRRLVEVIGLARKAGQAVTGFEKTRARLRSGAAGALIEASDAAQDGRRKIAAVAGDVPRIDCLDREELGLAFGRDFAIHAALDAGGFAHRALAEARRLEGLRHGGGDAKHARATAAHDHGRQEEPQRQAPDRTVDERDG